MVSSSVRVVCVQVCDCRPGTVCGRAMGATGPGGGGPSCVQWPKRRPHPEGGGSAEEGGLSRFTPALTVLFFSKIRRGLKEGFLCQALCFSFGVCETPGALCPPPSTAHRPHAGSCPLALAAGSGLKVGCHPGARLASAGTCGPDPATPPQSGAHSLYFSVFSFWTFLLLGSVCCYIWA